MNMLGYEDPVMMPTMQVYNTDLMKAYIAGVKEQYENARADMKEFMKQYGDFYSPIAKDTLSYYDLTTGGANKLIAEMMSRGIDPYKSPEARNMIAKYIASRPVGKLLEMKQSAEDAKEYLQMKAKLQAAGKWNEDYERYLLGGKSLEDWDTSKDGVWTRTSPEAYQDMFDVTSPWFAGMKDSYLYSKGGYDYTGITKDLMRPILKQSMSDYLNSNLGKYHYNTFAKNYKLLNPDANNQDITNAFEEEILAKNERITSIKREADPYSLDRAKTANDIYAAERKAAIKAKYDNNKKSSSEQSYADDMYKQGVAKIFGYDTDTAEQEMVNGNIGKTIYATQSRNIEKAKKQEGGYNIAKILRSSSISGNAESNVEMIGRPTGGTRSVGTGSLGKHTYEYNAKRDRESIKDGISIATTMAGYRNGKQVDKKVNNILSKPGTTVTVTDRLLTYLGKDGRVHQAVKVIVENGNESAVAYQEIQRSMSNGYGQAISSGGTREQPMMLDLTSDYQGRKTRNAKATQVYASKSGKDAGVYSDGTYDPDLDIDDED